ncbi:MAG: PAS domain S-box protein [Planctomycetota bacterium]
MRDTAKDGRKIHIESSSRLVKKDGQVIGLNVVARDVTERKRAEERQILVTKVLDLLNQSGEKIDTIREILLHIKESGGFEAVGIRLREGDDFPYYETNGFPAEFVKAEKSLCAQDGKGELIRDSEGNPVLECMCGNVICGRTDSSFPFFTEGGSFWSNCTTELLASTTEEDRQARTRNRCNGEGYESVALIPLRAAGETIGLLQLNDTRKNMFTLDMITFFEGIGASIGIALARKRAEEKYTNVVQTALDGFWINDAEGRFIDVNSSYCNMIGYTHEELLQMRIPDVEASETPEETVQHIKTVVEQGYDRFETRHRCKDGTLLDIEVSTRRNDVGGTDVFLKDITNRKRAEKKLLRYQKKLKTLASALLLAEERERHRIATELHDSIAQTLAIAKMKLGSFLKKEPAKDLLEVNELIEQATQDTRSLIFEISPPILYNIGLEAAVEWLCEQVESQHGVKCLFIDDGRAKPIEDDVRVLLFQATRELLVNIVKHADARSAKVSVSGQEERNILIAVEDDGIGFVLGPVNSRANGNGGFGLFSIRERLSHIGGRLEIESGYGRGTVATLIAPLKG